MVNAHLRCHLLAKSGSIKGLSCDSMNTKKWINVNIIVSFLSLSVHLTLFFCSLSNSKPVKPKNESSPESSQVTSSIIPCSQSGATASSSLDTSTTPQSSYVMSALRTFEWELFLFSLCVIYVFNVSAFYTCLHPNNSSYLHSLRPVSSTENTPVKRGSHLAKRSGGALCTG